MRLCSGCLLLALLTAGISVPAMAAQQLPPAAGRFLVATRTQQGFFAKSVILLLAYGSDGAIGVVINHPTKLELAKVLPDPSVLRGRRDLLYVGGPVALDDLTMLIRAGSALPASVSVLPGIYTSQSLTTLHAAVSQKLAAAQFRAYAGYAGWAPGQLESELAQGSWTVSPANANEVFTAAPESLWQRLNQAGSTLVVQIGGCGAEPSRGCVGAAIAARARLRAARSSPLD